MSIKRLTALKKKHKLMHNYDPRRLTVEFFSQLKINSILLQNISSTIMEPFKHCLTKEMYLAQEFFLEKKKYCMAKNRIESA